MVVARANVDGVAGDGLPAGVPLPREVEVMLTVTATTLAGTDAGQFAVILGGAPFSVAQGATHNITVRFEPSVAGTHTCDVETGDALCVDVFMTGVGEDPPTCSVSPDTLDFGTVTVGNTDRKSVV